MSGWQIGMTPMWAADQWFQTAIYYEDPDKNIIELTVHNFTILWAVTDGLKAAPAAARVYRPRKADCGAQGGASPWNVHAREASRPKWIILHGDAT